MTKPRYSVVIPTCGRPERLTAVLDLLDPTRQGIAPDEYEIIVSDDGDSDETSAGLRARFPHVRWLRGPGRGPAANRNHGARHAIGDWLIFTNDDCQPIEGWLRALATEASRGEAEVIEGKIVVPAKRPSVFTRDVENLTGGCFWSANLAIERRTFERLRGFDEDFGEAGGEDMEFAHRFRVNDLRTVFCPDALICHPSHVMTWRGVLRFAFRLRWHALYLIKTEQTLPLEAPAWKIALHVSARRTTDLLRTTWRTLRSSNAHPVAAVSRTAVNWVVFPALLPYMVIWHIRFVRMLRAR